MNKPGQGFKRGDLISFMALAWPLPDVAQNNLKSAAKEARSLRLQLEASPTSKAIRQEYDEAIRSLERVEKLLRSSIGVQETRPEFLSLKFTPAI